MSSLTREEVKRTATDKDELRDATPDRLKNTRGQKLPPGAKNKDVTCFVKPITIDVESEVQGLSSMSPHVMAFKEDAGYVNDED